jgi:predicted N-formylglutamate amidohydrolase
MIQGAEARLEALAQPGHETRAADPVVVENRAASSPFLILCDHASNAIPPEYGSLGLGKGEREAHIAWDPGALDVSRQLARELNATLVYATVSRLLIDCNRDPSDPDSIVDVTADSRISIPGNAGLSDAERRRRVASVHAPYHAAIEKIIGERLDGGRATSLIAVHSFTPVYRGASRPWEIGIVFDRNRHLADELIEALKAEGLVVGVNEPYSPADRVYYTLTRHAESRGLAAAMIEIRNDLIKSGEQAKAWGTRLAALIAASEEAKGWSAAASRRDRRSVA